MVNWMTQRLFSFSLRGTFSMIIGRGELLCPPKPHRFLQESGSPANQMSFPALDQLPPTVSRLIVQVNRVPSSRYRNP